MLLLESSLLLELFSVFSFLTDGTVDSDKDDDSSSLFLADNSRFLAINCLFFCRKGPTTCWASVSFRT